MQSIRVPDVSEDIIRSTSHAMTMMSQRLGWRVYAPRMAAAAVIAIVLFGLAFLASQTNPQNALADVAQRVLATKTLRAKFEGPNARGALFASGERVRLEHEDSVQINDSATGQNIVLDIKNKTAYRIPADETTQGMNLWEIFRGLTTAKSTPIDDIEVEGRKFSGFKAAAKLGKKHYFNVEIRFWVDPTTKLPIRLEMRFANMVVQFTDIEFDVPLDDTMFDMTFPAGYSVVGAAHIQPNPPVGKEVVRKLTIVPDVGIGDVKFGLSKQDIVALLGQPDFTYPRPPAGTYLVYQSLGIQLVLTGRAHGKLGMIDTNPTDAANSHNGFPGQTDKGIRIGSGRDAVTESYGNPDSGPNPVIYKKLGLTFYFSGDKVSEIVASRTNRGN